MAIDQDVRQTMDAYRGNPGALQKQYALDKDLIKLLALSKLKGEKDDAARQLTLSQQGQPGTIASQMGAEARERTVGEVTEQVSGVKAEQLKLRQRNMQQMAGGIPGARPGGPPQQMAGIAGQPAPNMARMAGGGIVSFAEGGVTDAQLERMKITRADFDSLTDAGKAMYLDKFAPIAKDASPLNRAFTGARDYFTREDVKNRLAIEAMRRAGDPTGLSKVGEYIFGTQEGYDALKKKQADAYAEANRIQAFGRPPAAKKAPAAAVAPPASGIAAAAAAAAPAAASGYKDLDREGLAARYEKMRAARAGVAEKNAAERKSQGFYDLFAGAAGTGLGSGLSGIGARGTVLAENRRRQAMLDVAGDAKLNEESIVRDLAMAGLDVRTMEGKQKAISQLESKIADLELKWEKALSDALTVTSPKDRPAARKAFFKRKRAALAGPKKALNKLLGIADSSDPYAGFGTLSEDSKKSTS